jgi:hypothetical protein
VGSPKSDRYKLPTTHKDVLDRPGQTEIMHVDSKAGLGPFGKRYLLVRSGGVLEISKTRIAGGREKKSLMDHMKEITRVFGDRCGDGNKLISIYVKCLVYASDTLLVSPLEVRMKVQLLQCIVAIRTVTSQRRDNIVSFMTGYGGWCNTLDPLHRFRKLCRTTSLPSSNAYYANMVENLLVSASYQHVGNDMITVLPVPFC